MSDDCSSINYETIINKNIIYLMNEEKTGVIRIDPFNGCTCQAHIATLPELWGKADQFVKEALCWGFTYTRYLKVIAFIPIFNKLTIRLVKNNGFREEGCILKSFLKNWKLHNLLIFGLTKESFLTENISCRQLPVL